MKIKNIREQAAFRASARLAEGGRVRVIGTLTRGKASGNIQFEGTLPTDDGPDATGCEGGAGWTASR